MEIGLGLSVAELSVGHLGFENLKFVCRSYSSATFTSTPDDFVYST